MKRFHNDQDLFKSIGKLYINQVDQQILNIKNHVRNNDWSQAARVVHQLRGAMLNFTEEHNEYYENIEKQIADGHFERSELERFLNHAEQTKSWISGHLEQKSA